MVVKSYNVILWSMWNFIGRSEINIWFLFSTALIKKYVNYTFISESTHRKYSKIKKSKNHHGGVYSGSLHRYRITGSGRKMIGSCAGMARPRLRTAFVSFLCTVLMSRLVFSLAAAHTSSCTNAPCQLRRCLSPQLETRRRTMHTEKKFASVLCPRVPFQYRFRTLPLRRWQM